MTIPAELLSALDAQGLTADDLPGIEKAWAARFGRLDGPAPEDTIAVLRRLFPDADILSDEDAHVETTAPVRGGGIKVTVEVDGRWDDVLDEIVGDKAHDFTLDTAQADQFLTAEENYAERRAYAALTTERDQYISGQRKVWWLLSKNPAETADKHQYAKNDYQRALSRLETLEGNRKVVTHLEECLAEAKPISEKIVSVLPGTSHSRSVTPATYPTAEQRDHWGKDKRAVGVRDVSELITKLAEALPKAEQMEQAMAEAQALPEGPLRDFLLATRPEKEYFSTEGRGARAKRVRYTFRPESELVEKHKKATKKAKELTAERKTLAKSLAFIGRDIDKHIAAAAKDAAKAETDRAKAFAAGLPGGITPPEDITVTATSF